MCFILSGRNMQLPRNKDKVIIIIQLRFEFVIILSLSSILLDRICHSVIKCFENKETNYLVSFQTGNK